MLSDSQKKLFWMSFFAGVAAVGAHIYLTQHHLDFRYGDQAGHGLCNLSDRMNCEHTSGSAYSEVLGVPIALFGALANFIFLGLLLAYRYPLVSKSTQYALTTSLKLLSLAIFLVSLIMAGISVFVLKALCPVCAFTYVASFVAFLATWKMMPGNLGFSMFEVKLIPSLSALVLVGGLMINHNLKKSYVDSDLEDYLKIQVSEWQSRMQQKLATHEPLTTGPETAAMTVVEFADYLCGHCATAFPTIHAFLKKHPEVRFEFQAFPLDGACNPAIPQSSGVSCYLSQVVQCSKAQGADPFALQEFIFKNQGQLLGKDMAEKVLQEKSSSLGLNWENLQACTKGPESLQVIRSQAEVGNQVGISGTPTFYVNGRKVQGALSVPLFERLLKEIKKQAKAND